MTVWSDRHHPGLPGLMPNLGAELRLKTVLEWRERLRVLATFKLVLTDNHESCAGAADSALVIRYGVGNRVHALCADPIG